MKKNCLLFCIFMTFLSYIYALGPEPQHCIGYEYYICDEPINVRDEQGMNSNIIDKLYIGDKVKIINFGELEAIDGNYRYYWTNIEFHNGKIGWIYGKYIANFTVVCDLDKNGINDYIFFRQRNDGMYLTFEFPEDIMIYLNGKQRLLPNFPTSTESHAYFYKSQNNDKVLFSIEYIYDSISLPGEGEFISGPRRRSIMLFLVENNTIELVKHIEGFDCGKTTNDDGSVSDELKSIYVEPYLGKNYIFLGG